jgi:HEAT repeat protein
MMSSSKLMQCGLLVLAVGCAWNRAAAQEDEADPAPSHRYEWIGPLTPLERAEGALLREARRADDARRAQIVADIVAPGGMAVGGLIEILVQERVPAGQDGDAPQCLSQAQRAIVLSALARLPSKDVRTRLSERRSSAAGPDASVAALCILGIIGDEDDLRQLASIPARNESGMLDSASLSALRAAYAGILRRAPRAYDLLEDLRTKLPDDAREELLKALADVGDGRALEVLFECARTQPASRGTAVALVPLLAPSRNVQIAREFSAFLREQVDLSRPDWTRSVFNALAVLDEGGAIPALLECVESQQLPLRESSLAALRRISGLSFGSERRRWESWYRDELAWFGRPRSAPLARARLGESPLDILRDYAGHRLFRSDLAAEIAPLLDQRDPAIRAMVCQTLERLGSQRAVRDLIPILDDPVPQVAGAARHALETLVGGHVPDSASAARDILLHES